MKRLALVVIGCAVSLFLVAVPASADNGPHVAGAGPIADSCAGCHRAHTAQASYLLKEAQPGLCYTCHGTSATGANTDVQDGVGYTGSPYPTRSGPAKALRGGGFSYALIDSASPSGQRNTYYNPYATIPVRSTGAAVTSTHSVDSSNQTAWGNGAINAPANAGTGKTVQLRCGSCHDPHGNGNYRILKPIPADSGVTPSTSGVVIPDASPKVYTTTDYWQVEDTNAPGFIANVAAWCATCHTRYLAGSGGARNNSGDAVYTYRHRANDTGEGTPNCIQCHVSHGSNASMGTYSSAVTAPGPSGITGADSRLLRVDNRGTCQMCHLR